jgi:SAM-dependent methyltransferase
LPESETIAARYTASGGWIKSTNIVERSQADGRFYQYAKALEQIIPRGSKILEIGCSKGRLLYLLQQRGFDCFGVEPSRDAEIASQLLGADRITRGAYTQPLSFAADAVTMFEVLEHIPEPHRIAATVFTQLRSGGYFMGSVPNGMFIRAKVWPKRRLGLRSLMVPLIMDAGNHINYFSADGIQTMLERIGFEFLWVTNAPLDFNYTANRFSPLVKRAWWPIAQLAAKSTGKLLGSNIWFLARRPS